MNPPIGWEKLILPNGWSLYAPKGFKVITYQGIDSDPGRIYFGQDTTFHLRFDSSQDSTFFLSFDSGVDVEILRNLRRDSCKQMRNEAIEKGSYLDFHHVHTAYIDTVSDLLAVIVKPKKSGIGTLLISVSDCWTGAWLGIRGENVPKDKEEVVLGMFRTLEIDRVEANRYWKRLMEPMKK